MIPFTEIKHRLDGSVAKFQCSLVHRNGDHLVLRYEITGRGGEVAGVRLPGGTVTFGYYWVDRPYNVYHWLLPDATTAAHYFNLADRTVIGDGFVEWRDLTLDILITPDGRCQVLDEDELPPDLDAALRSRLEHGQREIMESRARIVAEIEAATRGWLAVSAI